jgi:ribosomal protein L12E/L44/L45/RPP1/RPP2
MVLLFSMNDPVAPTWDPAKAEEWQALLQSDAVQARLAEVVSAAATVSDSEGLQGVIANLRSVVGQSLAEVMPQMNAPLGARAAAAPVV